MDSNGATKRVRTEIFRIHVLIGGESPSNRQVEPFMHGGFRQAQLSEAERGTRLDQNGLARSECLT